jgi:thiamine-monophosphate kinase
VKVSELGEFGLIKLLADVVGKAKDLKGSAWKNLLIGIGDDAAAWKSESSVQLATTDSLIQDIHFELGISTWGEVGWKAIAVNLSDIAAMGGVPRYVMVSLALPGETEVDCVTSMYQGMLEIAGRFEVAIIGGNISSASKVMVSVALLGILEGKSMLTRHSAKIGDQIAITGYTGLSAGGLQMLRHNLKFDEEATRLFRAAHLKPVPRINEGQALLNNGIKSAIDISDGLIADLSHICEASNVGARITQSLIPIHPLLQANFKDDCQQFALSGGEDYELLFTAPAQSIRKVQKILPCPVTVIGEIIGKMAGQVILTDAGGNNVLLQSKGWEHFKPRA